MTTGPESKVEPADDVLDAHHIWPQIAELRGKVGALEVQIDNARKSLFKRVSEWAGLLALFIAISTGAFTIHQKLVVEPREDRDAQLEILREAVAEITRVTQQWIQTSANLSEDERIALGSVLNGIKLPAMRRAQRVIDQYPDLVDPESLLVIANEQILAGRSDTAMSNARLAIGKSEEAWLKAEAHRYVGIAQWSAGIPEAADEARQTFRIALDTAAKDKSQQGWASRANTYRDWMTLAAASGYCDEVRALWSEMEAQLGGPEFRAMLAKYQSMVRTQAQQSQNCRL